ncbi:MAG TPA: YbaK/EbsC family protein [Rhabdochlamydiaceae bacterium]|nr:YbaK/EbsC family protein [Rhabdochlamydiaceae bacterium]
MTENLRDSAQRVQNILREYHLETKVIEFKELTRTAQEAASAIGCDVGQIAKTLIFRGKISKKPICVIASGKNRVDEKKVTAYLEEEIEKPDADYVLTHTSFSIGGIPPVGFAFELKPIIDEDLMSYKEIWAAAGTPYAVFQITPEDLLKITSGKVLNIRK